MTSQIKQPPRAVGLYDPRFEHDACGVGMVARLDNRPTHDVIVRAITALENLEHRGASGADPCTGDGAGILMQMPDELLRAVVDFELPPPGAYGVLMCFLPTDAAARGRLESLLEQTVSDEGQVVLGWRDVPVNQEHAGEVAGACRPEIRQLFVGAAGAQAQDQDSFERKLYVIRRVCELTAPEPGLYVASSSSRTLNYKGMLISYQLAAFYPDLRDERTKSALALVHSRFSTNTFPSWELAHPYRVICHNGEINTVMGNVNWMRARESELRSELFGDDLEKILPVVSAGNSDSATFDNVLELLLLAGRSLQHAAMMMIPEAYRGREDLPEELKGFYAFHSCLMEPWDGPASVAFTDGRVVGATLDRNGLRPGRWVETTDGHVVLGSESGLLDIPPEQVKRLGRLQPGKLFLVDLERGRIVEDEEVKREVSTRRPYHEWYARSSVPFSELPAWDQVTISDQPLHTRQRAFGYSQEDLRVDGQRPFPRGALGAGPGAVLVLQAAVRAGHKPADRLDPRGHRHELVDEPRDRAEPVRRDTRARPQAGPESADPAQPRAGDARARLTRPVRRAHDQHHMVAREGRGRDERGDRADLP
jgi:glutamate synthase domain-containing protein 1